MNSPLLEGARHALRSQPFSSWLGAELTRIDAQGVELRLPILERVHQQHGFAHGGVLAYAADNAIAFAAGALLGPDSVTAEMKINYLRPARGAAIVARANAAHAGRRQAVCRCDVFVLGDDGSETLCALAQGTVALLGEPQGR
jgi:uncharacterized protein (TIGR00369 family)